MQRGPAARVDSGATGARSRSKRSTLNLITAGLPMLPASSAARTEIACFIPLPAPAFALAL